MNDLSEKIAELEAFIPDPSSGEVKEKIRSISLEVAALESNLEALQCSEKEKVVKWFYSGMIGFSVLLLLQLMSQNTLTWQLMSSLYCLAIALPCLVVTNISVASDGLGKHQPIKDQHHDGDTYLRIHALFGGIGSMAFALAFVALVAHFSVIASGLFFVISIYCGITMFVRT